MAQEQAAALVWMRERPTRTGRPALSEERIVATAIAIADAEGIDTLSMRRIATELNSGTTSLYRYLTDKDELIELMVDAVHGEQAPPTRPSGDWRADLADIAQRSRAGLLRHPWLVAQASQRPALGPNALAGVEYALSAVGAATDDINLASSVMGAVDNYVLGAVTAELAEHEAQRRTGQTEQQWRARVAPYISEIIESGRHPQFARRVIEADDPTAEQRFEFGLRCVLNGIAEELAAPSAPTQD
jgi:AcrR family transcriptional regulator